MRRKRGLDDRRILLEETFEALTMSEYGVMVAADHAAVSYGRLVELAAMLDMHTPPALRVLAIRGSADDW